MQHMELLHKAETLVTHSTMQFADEPRYGSDWVMSLTDEDLRDIIEQFASCGWI